MSQYFLSEWKLETKAQDIPLHIYIHPIKDWEEKESELYPITQELRKANPGQAIEFKQQLIASFRPIENKDPIKDCQYQRRIIDLNSLTERLLLEQLLLRELMEALSLKGFYLDHSRNRVMEKEPLKIKNVPDIVVRRGCSLDITVNEKGEIFLGFDMAHQFMHQKDLYELLLEGKVTQGDAVFDPFRRKRYLFSEVLDTSIAETTLPDGRNLIEYNSGDERKKKILEKIDPQTPAVKVETKGSKNKKYLYFIPQLLRLEPQMDTIPYAAQRETRLSADKKISQIISYARNFLNIWKHHASFPLHYCDKGLQIEGRYQIHKLTEPYLLIGNGYKTKHVLLLKQLKQKGVVDQKRSIKYRYLIDADEWKSIVQRGEFPFADQLETRSEKLGICLEREKGGRKSLLSFTNPNQLRVTLKSLENDLDCLTVIITSEKKAKYYYQTVKQELGARLALATQFVTTKTILSTNDPAKNTNAIEYIYMNTLLQIYAKSGIQPWLLSKALHSDCFIGLDKSREEGRHAAGLVQVVGKDGRILWSNPITSHDSGEIINQDTLSRIVSETIYQYQKHRGQRPRHITIHRDGLGHREEIDWLTEIFRDHGISFDYVSIIKSTNRRMAKRDPDKQRWKNADGIAYIQNNLGYLCTTDPKDHIGMAQTIKVKKWCGSQSMKNIMEDIYALSFMNIHALNKSRLPVTINYADKSASYYNRGMLPQTGDPTALYFV